MKRFIQVNQLLLLVCTFTLFVGCNTNLVANLSHTNQPHQHHSIQKQAPKRAYLAEVQQKLMQDSIAFSAFQQLGMMHCTANNNAYSNQFSKFFNNMTAMVRLIDEVHFKNYFEKIRQQKPKQTCEQIYHPDKLKPAYIGFVLNDTFFKKIETTSDDDDILLNRLDYLNLGKIDYKRLLDNQLPVIKTLATDNQAVNDFQHLGLSYCNAGKSGLALTYQQQISDMHAFAWLFQKNALIQTYDAIIKTKKTNATCAQLFITTDKTYYLAFIRNISHLKDNIQNYGNPRQNMIDYLNLGNIDKKRFANHHLIKKPHNL